LARRGEHGSTLLGRSISRPHTLPENDRRCREKSTLTRFGTWHILPPIAALADSQQASMPLICG
jgi:hypothetical protein